MKDKGNNYAKSSLPHYFTTFQRYLCSRSCLYGSVRVMGCRETVSCRPPPTAEWSLGGRQADTGYLHYRDWQAQQVSLPLTAQPLVKCLSAHHLL